ncbi:MAG: hypothetical protein ACLQLC_17750 [Candidatus Sulfotelmatobacter sp.]
MELAHGSSVITDMGTQFPFLPASPEGHSSQRPSTQIFFRRSDAGFSLVSFSSFPSRSPIRGDETILSFSACFGSFECLTSGSLDRSADPLRLEFDSEEEAAEACPLVLELDGWLAEPVAGAGALAT